MNSQTCRPFPPSGSWWRGQWKRWGRWGKTRSTCSGTCWALRGDWSPCRSTCLAGRWTPTRCAQPRRRNRPATPRMHPVKKKRNTNVTMWFHDAITQFIAVLSMTYNIHLYPVLRRKNWRVISNIIGLPEHRNKRKCVLEITKMYYFFNLNDKIIEQEMNKMAICTHVIFTPRKACSFYWIL